MQKWLRWLRMLDPMVHWVILAISYIVLSLVLPANQNTAAAYHLTPSEYHILDILIIMPYIAIWLVAFYGYKMLGSYAQLLGKGPEAGVFHGLARGVRWLAWGLPISSIVSVILYAFVHSHPGFYPPALIVNHYVSLLFAVVGFGVISNATHRLSLGDKRPSLGGIRGLMAIFILFGVAYCYGTFRQIIGQQVNAYHLPVWLILLTLVVPYLYAWFMGAVSAYEMTLYSRHVSGLLYKRALRLLAAGIVAVTGASIVIQYLTSSSPALTRLHLNWLLTTVYVFLAVYAAGYCLIALGAKRLRKIEEV